MENIWIILNDKCLKDAVFEESKGFGVSQVWVSEGFCNYKEGQTSFIKKPLHNEM